MKSQPSNEDLAAAKIQRILKKKYDKHHQLDRKNLIERIALEEEMTVTFWLFLLYGAIFALLLQSMFSEMDPGAQRGLHRSYERNFALDSVGDITTVEELRTFLQSMSKASRRMQIQSSEYFVTAAEQKIVSGLVSLTAPLSLLAGGLSARIDSPAFSISAWVELGSSAGAYVIRKPLRPTGTYYALSCWGLYVGQSEMRFDFGAHDSGRLDVGQASVSVPSNSETVSSLHMQTVVVNQTHISFFTNAVLVGRKALTRAVTDCSSEGLEVGGDGMRLGEIVFYPRALSPSQVGEVFIGGNTLESLAAGKTPFEPQETPFDRLQSYSQGRFDAQQQTQEDAIADSGIEQVLLRGLVSNLEGSTKAVGLALPVVAPEAGCVGEKWPPCRMIRGVNATLALDPNSNAHYYDLLPATNFPGMVSGGRLTISSELRRHQYDLASFPNSIGPSFSFSGWLKPVVAGSSTYLISKHPSSAKSPRCWSFNLASSRVGLYAGAKLQGLDTDDGLVYFAEGVGEEFGLVNGPLLRHVVLVMDAELGQVRAYMDGQRIGAVDYDTEMAKVLDCPNDGAYVAMLHRAPESHDYVGDMQQFHLFPGVALSDAQVAAIHAGSTDPTTGKPIRECSFSDEGLDTSFRDLMGHNCAWFDEARQSNPAVCVAQELKAQCPVACGEDRECYIPPSELASTAESSVWERVMWVKPKKGSTHAMCLASHVDARALVARCRAGVLPEPPGVVTGDDPNGIRSTALEGLLNASNCDELEAAIDPFCAFEVPDMWTQPFEDGLTQGDDFTISMWVRALPDTTLDAEGRFRPVIQLFSAIAPSQPILTLHFFDKIFYAILARHCGNAQNVGVGTSTGTLDKDAWVHVSVIWEDLGERGYKLSIMMNSQIKSELHVPGWCKADSGEFLQGIAFSHELLVSSVRIRRYAVPEKILQKEFYANRPAMRLRSGPKQRDETRLTEAITYLEKPYTATGFLLAPPLLLQERVGKTDQCTSELGSTAIRSTWEDITRGFHCSTPFACSSLLMASPLQIASCSKADDAGRLFGRGRHHFAGRNRFAEFLSSITDGPVVVRQGQVYETERFIDGQTHATEVVMTLVSPDKAVVSTLTVTAHVGTEVKVSYSIRHIQSVEGALLQSYKTFGTWTLIVTVLLLVSCLMRALQTLAPKGQRRQALSDVLLALLVICFVTIRWHSNDTLGPELAAHVGRRSTTGAAGTGLLGVPWDAEDVAYDDKIAQFFEEFEGLSSTISAQQRLDLFGFLISVAMLVRIIVVISVHPRVSLLVATVTTGIDDFVHFFLLLGILIMCFGLIALLRFAPKYDDFANFEVTLVSQFQLMLGNLPDNFADDILLSIFILFFLIAVFFLMLNFLLAIIVESYMRVKAEIERQETEQNLMADAGASLVVMAKRLLHRWPSTFRIIARLEEQSSKFSVGIENLDMPDGSWSRESRVHFYRHYQRYDFLAKKPLPERITSFDCAVDDLEKRIALLVHAPAPTAMERTIHMAMVARDERRRKSLEAPAFNRTSPALLDSERVPRGSVALASPVDAAGHRPSRESTEPSLSELAVSSHKSS